MDLFGHLDGYDYGEVHFKLDKATGLKRHRRDPRHAPGPGARRLPLHPLRHGRGRAGRRAPPRARHDLQGRARRAAARRRQERAHPAARSTSTASRSSARSASSSTTCGGHYITAEDSGTGLEDMEVIRTVTKHVTGVDPSHGGSGDPSPFTALGVRRGIEACVQLKLGKKTLEGVHVAVQGVGHVGYHLCKELARARGQALGRRRRPAQGRARAPRVRREGRPARRHLRRRLRRLRAVRARLGAQRPDHPAHQGDDRRRRREQPARRAAPRRRPERARHPLRARLRHQRRRPHQRRQEVDRLRRGQGARQDAEDLRHHPRDRRAQREAARRRPTRSPT